MPDTLQSLTVKNDAWTNAYTATSVAVGEQLVCTVLSGSIVAVVKATEPTEADGKIPRKAGEQFTNQSGDSGLWLRSTSDLAVVNVSEY